MIFNLEVFLVANLYNFLNLEVFWKANLNRAVDVRTIFNYQEKYEPAP